MQKKNYQKMLDEILADKENYGKKLLLHSCCAPCSSYVLEESAALPAFCSGLKRQRHLEKKREQIISQQR